MHIINERPTRTLLSWVYAYTTLVSTTLVSTLLASSDSGLLLL